MNKLIVKNKTKCGVKAHLQDRTPKTKYQECMPQINFTPFLNKTM